MVNALSDGMRLELAPYGIRLITYCPPATDSGFDARSIKGPGVPAADFEGMKTAKTADVATDIARAIAREKPRVGGGFFRVMNAAAPKLLDRMFGGMVKRFGVPGVAGSADRAPAANVASASRGGTESR